MDRTDSIKKIGLIVDNYISIVYFNNMKNEYRTRFVKNRLSAKKLSQKNRK
jgi:hypothetical protein